MRVFFGSFFLGLIVLAIVTALSSKTSVGISGIVEKRCIDGYQFLIGQEGRIQQVLNESGGGVRCQ